MVPQFVSAHQAFCRRIAADTLTLSFIPTLGTMILGLAAGRWLIADSPRVPMKRFLIAGAVGIAAGLLLHFAGICPIVKRIWTPSWTLFSGGLCFLFLAAFGWIIDVRGHQEMGVSIDRCRDELDGRLSHGALVRIVSRGLAPHPSGSRALPTIRRGCGTAAARRDHSAAPIG